MSKEIIVDSFAGGGGASLGIAWATGRAPDIAINHDADALAMHEANHPSTLHVCEDVWHAKLEKLVAGRPVGLLWLSPDCRHHSRAKGSMPVSKKIRSLAWIAVKWASRVKPRIIALENVREFEMWGPVVPRWECDCGWRGTEGQTILYRRRPRCPRCESTRLRETPDMVPDPARKGMTFRLFANRLRGFGYRVQWKTLNAADFGAPTHRRRLFLVARRDGEPTRWPEPTHGNPEKLHDQPLFSQPAPWRTAAECLDWAVPCPSIFGRERPLAERTLRRIALGMQRYVLEAAEPFIVPLTHAGERRSHPISEPLPTITSAHRGEYALISPIVASLAHGGGGTWNDSRSKSPNHPLGTIHAGGNNHALAAAFLSRYFGKSVGSPLTMPGPVEMAACLARFNHGEKQWNSVEEPLGTITSQGNKFGLVYAFLVKFFGTAIGQPATDPLHTITSKDRFAVVQVEVRPGKYEPAIAINVPGRGPYVISDIGMRMLTPRELARCQGFPDTYVLTGTKTNQVAKIGNSVSPYVAAAIVRENYCEAGAGSPKGKGAVSK